MITLQSQNTQMLADSYTPVSLYRILRDSYPNALLLESNDFHHLENCFSYIALDPIAKFSVTEDNISTQIIGQDTTKQNIKSEKEIKEAFKNFTQQFKLDEADEGINGFFGYLNFESVKFMDTNSTQKQDDELAIPLIRYGLYRFIISFNHLQNQLYIHENIIPGEESQLKELISTIKTHRIPDYPFQRVGPETSSLTDEDFRKMVTKAKQHCKRGDVFQLVLSRRFSQEFTGDEFNLYRQLRSLNPSPYLFFFDYSDYKIFGSSPEMELVTKGGEAFINPIAGTFARSGQDEEDEKRAKALLEDPKENAEHVMLVDLARNDLSKSCRNVEVERFKEIQFFSHVIHIVSTVKGKIKQNKSAIDLLFETFPAGTLSGAPKHKAIELINQYEPKARGFYGGCIGFIGANGESNHAITIRSFFSKKNHLHYQAGAGIVISSDEEKELQEVDHKLAALKNAIELSNKSF